jgi:hypothetical protein
LTQTLRRNTFYPAPAKTPQEFCGWWMPQGEPRRANLQVSEPWCLEFRVHAAPGPPEGGTPNKIEPLYVLVGDDVRSL